MRTPWLPIIASNEYPDHVAPKFLISFQLIVPESHAILLDGSELLGLTSESNVGMVSLKRTLPAATRFRNVPVSSTSMPQFPEIGFTYSFGTLPYPAIFSIGAIIDNGMYNGLLRMNIILLFCSFTAL